MITTTHAATHEQAAQTVSRGVGLPGRIAITFTAAGGLLLGGFLVAAMTLAGRLSGNALLLTSGALFLVGGLLGFAHGAVLGYFGRPAGMPRGEAARRLALSAVYAIPTLAVGLVAAGWIAMLMVARYTGRVLPLTVSGLAWVAGAVLVAAAVAYGWRGLRNAYARWPQRRLGTALVAASYAALLVTFLAERPMVWGIRMRVTEVGAFLLAAFVTVWIVGPVVTVALRLYAQLPVARRAAPASPVHTLGSVALGLAGGIVLGLLALPFYGPPLQVAAPTQAGVLGSVAVAASQALISEVLLRLFVATAVAWVLLRWHRVHPAEAAVAAVAAGALTQVVLYLPGVIGLGLPSAAATLAFVGVVVALPAVTFGLLYWTRGFGTAVLAHATALAVIALLAV